MIDQCQASDIQRMYFIINEAARVYESVIPADCYHQPYMPLDELEQEMQRVTFFGWKVDGEFVGVMGMEPIKDVTLIRHAWAIAFYLKHGFSLLPDKDDLLKNYWGIPQRQIETSIVMGIDINRN